MPRPASEIGPLMTTMSAPLGARGPRRLSERIGRSPLSRRRVATRAAAAALVGALVVSPIVVTSAATPAAATTVQGAVATVFRLAGESNASNVKVEWTLVAGAASRVGERCDARCTRQFGL